MKTQSARCPSSRGSAVLVGVSLVLGLTALPASIRAQGEIRSFPSRLVVGRETLSDLVDVAAGPQHHLALKASGEVVGWGGAAAVCVPPDPNGGFIAVATIVEGSYALRSDGSIVGWPAWVGLPSPNEGFVAIDGGESYALALREDGSVAAWGYDPYGQCDVPAPNEGFAAISAGDDICIGLKVDGSIVTWGRHDAGQCVPPSPAGYIAVAAGSEHLLALRSNGSIAAWGRNDEGQCNVPSPNAGFVAIAAGARHSLGLKSDGTIVGWGDNGSGQCETPHTNQPVVKLSVSGDYSIALLDDGTIWEWGCRYRGSECHLGASAEYAGFVKMAIGPNQIVGLRGDGTLAWWGTMICPAYEQPAPLPTIELIDIAASDLDCLDWDCWAYGLGVTRDGSIVGWGCWDSTWVPQPNSGFVSTAPALGHALALHRDGSIATWGYNQYGECDVPEPNSGFVSVAATMNRSAALRANGMIEVWGYAPELPDPNGGFVALAMSDRHCLGLREDGSILAWGTNESGECDVPEPNSGFVAIATGTPPRGAFPGGAWSCGVKEDGTILTWGRMQDTPSPNEGYLSVATSTVWWGSTSLGGIGLWDPAGFVADTGGHRGTSTNGGGRSGLELTGLPNPFAPSLQLRYRLAAPSSVRLAIFDVGGRQVRSFALGARASGEGSVRWDGRDDEGRNLPAGAYFARITDGTSEAGCRLVLVR